MADDFNNALERPEDLTILATRPGRCTIAVWGGDVCIVHWMGQADAPAMMLVHESFDPVVKAHPRGVSFLHLVEDGAGLPDPGARRALSTMTSSFTERTVCVAIVLMGNGFWASAMQSLLTGMRLVAPPRPWTMRFASQTGELSHWLPRVHVERTRRVIRAEALDAALQAVLAVGAQARAVNQ